MSQEFDEPIQTGVKKSGGKKKKPMSRRTKYIWAAAIGIPLIAFIVYVWSGLPSLEELENPKSQLASKVYSIDGEIIGQFFIENRIETDIDSLPAHVVQALIATEDRKFYDHWGVDVDRIFKAILKNVFTLSRSGGGASTITQQLSKNLYNLRSSNENFIGTGIRKIREWITAIQIERTFTKREILEMYLNVSYFGKSAYGVESAAKVYFNKRGRDLTLSESALLIGLLKSSVVYDPERHLDRAIVRRNVVLKNMVDAGFINENLYDQVKNEPITLARGHKVKMRGDAPNFIEYIRQQMESIAEKHGYDLYRDGLSIYTTLDSRMQIIANKVAAEHLKEYQEIFYKNWKWDSNKDAFATIIDKAIKNSQEYRDAAEGKKIEIYAKLKMNPRFVDSVKTAATTIQVGFVVIDPTNGQIRALVGAANQDFSYGLNHVTQIRRQPGSSFKPFVYTVAMDNGYFPAYSLPNQKFSYNGWSPSNSDGEYGGNMTLREALAKSVNVIAGRLTISDIAPPSEVIKYAHKMGIKSDLNPYPSIALGTSEVTPLELATGFSTIASGGVYHSPVSIIRVEDRNGIVLEEFRGESYEAVSKSTAALVTSMMEDVLNYGTGASARKFFHRPAAGKTGTTQDFADAWFSGFTPQLVGTVWVGFDDRRIRFNGWYGQGARAALPIWAKFMAEVYDKLKLPMKYFDLPEGVTSVEFCKESIERGDARVANANCPNKVSDLVKSDKIPENCNIHGGGRSAPRKDDSRW
jgi:penicillin-binding protein 1A